MEFRAWPKTPRLFRDVVITEKIDGTNAAVIVGEDGQVAAQSRNRLITPDADNYGFAAWVYANTGALADTLGPGYHYGEWWGSGIQRGYGQAGKRFSLFNVKRWAGHPLPVAGLDLVPVLYVGTFSEAVVRDCIEQLRGTGSAAAPGFARPEGVIVYHTAAGQVFKVLLDGDELPKGAVA